MMDGRIRPARISMFRLDMIEETVGLMREIVRARSHET